MNKRNGTMVLAALLLGTTMNVMADDSPLADVRFAREHVRFDDLDLAKPAGVATLHWRLRTAANDVCVRANQPRFACRQQTLDRALATLPASVSAYHGEWRAAGADWLQSPRRRCRRDRKSTRLNSSHVR